MVVGFGWRLTPTLSTIAMLCPYALLMRYLTPRGRWWFLMLCHYALLGHDVGKEPRATARASCEDIGPSTSAEQHNSRNCARNGFLGPCFNQRRPRRLIVLYGLRHQRLLMANISLCYERMTLRGAMLALLSC
ncbi:hypothetical protein Cni_G10038 [Canna indica]|uniref:Uncharacterized protein n=1 Tax=Canna indica TaxID=4628 RepID=A0AAQ3K6X4_9LILI|nr:hypothetical protein Cni_G10038 [Canna indica]